MAFTIEFPAPSTHRIVETELMRSVVRRTIAVHPLGQLVLWTGPSRNGKTETARWLVREIETQYDTSPYAFRALHYETGEISDGGFGGDAMKKAIKSLYHETIGRLAPGTYKASLAQDLARQLVHGLQAKNIQMVLVDEAGLLSIDAIRGMVLVSDVAANMDWRLTIVLVGMDDLATKVRGLDQVKNRISEWCYFAPYSLEETAALLAALHPHFAALSLSRAADRAQMEFVHEQFGGLPGLIVPFLHRLSVRATRLPPGTPISLELLRVTHLLTDRDEERAVADAMERGPTRDLNIVRSRRPRSRARGGSSARAARTEERA